MIQKIENGLRLFDRIERRMSYSQMVYETLKEKMVSLELPPGTRLSENLLAEQFNISRSPVREALKLLEGDRLVVTIPQKGSFVTKIVPKDILDACEMRLLLEKWALDRFEQNPPELDEDEFNDVLRAQKKAEDEHLVARYLDLDSRFHGMIIAAAGNDHATRMYTQTHTAIVRVRAWSIQQPGEWPRGFEEHQKIYRALVAGDYSHARELLTHQVEMLYPTLDELVKTHPEYCGDDPA